MEYPEISVVMPAYNAAKYIFDSISSVLNQSFSSWELIVIDDGSIDTTAEVVKGFLPNSKIRLIQQKNKGVSAARNKGIRAASGNYIAFLDADDAYLPANLELKYKAINSDSSIEYVYSDVFICDTEMKELFVEKSIAANEIRDAILTWKTKNISSLSSNLMIRYTVLKDKNIYFDENISNCADRYYKILIASECNKGAYISVPLIKYRNTPNSMSKKIALLEHDELYILDKIKEKNIIPDKKERMKIFAKVYLMLSGSWFKNGKHIGRAILFGLRAIVIYPGAFFMLAKKVFMCVFKREEA